METITTIGFDIAKSVFQVHGVDAVGQVGIRRQIKHRPVLAFFEKLPRHQVTPASNVHLWACIVSFECTRAKQPSETPFLYQ
jgi:transposase